jgi:hypothetical protein
VIGYWTNVDPELGANVAAGLSQGDGNGAGPGVDQASQTAS